MDISELKKQVNELYDDTKVGDCEQITNDFFDEYSCDLCDKSLSKLNLYYFIRYIIFFQIF